MPNQRCVIAPRKTCECLYYYVVGNTIPTATDHTKERAFNGYSWFLFRTELEETFLSRSSAENISSSRAKQEADKSLGEDSHLCKWEERKHMSCLKH